jgi:hypothetical protein
VNFPGHEIDARLSQRTFSLFSDRTAGKQKEIRARSGFPPSGNHLDKGGRSL